MLRRLQKNGQGNIRLGTSKAESEAFEADKTESAEVIEMNTKWAKGYKKIRESENERLSREVSAI